MNDLADQDFLKSILAPGFWRLFPMSLFAFSILLLAFPMVLKAPGGSLKTFAG